MIPSISNVAVGAATLIRNRGLTLPYSSPPARTPVLAISFKSTCRQRSLEEPIKLNLGTCWSTDAVTFHGVFCAMLTHLPTPLPVSFTLPIPPFALLILFMRADVFSSRCGDMPAKKDTPRRTNMGGSAATAYSTALHQSEEPFSTKIANRRPIPTPRRFSGLPVPPPMRQPAV